MAAAFELQRRSIEFGERLFEQLLTAQRDTMQTTMHNGFAMQREAQEQGAELARRLFHAQTDAVQATVNGDEFRAIVDRQFEAYDDEGAAAMEAFENAFLDAFEDLTAQQRDFVVESVDSALDAHATVEKQAIESAGRTRDVAKTAQRQGEEFASETVTATEQGLEAADEEAAVHGQTRGAQQARTTHHDDAQNDSGHARQEERHTRQETIEQLEAIDGLGPTYAERLYEGGIHSMTELADAAAETIADEADVATSRAEEWIEVAQST